MAFLFLAINHN